MSDSDRLEIISRSVIDCGYQIHGELGRGLLEPAYEARLAAAVTQLGYAFRRQVPTYLHLLKLPRGMLMNLGQAIFKDGQRRIANDYYGTIG